MEDTDFDGLLGEEESGKMEIEPSQAWLLEDVEDVEDVENVVENVDENVDESMDEKMDEHVEQAQRGTKPDTHGAAHAEEKKKKRDGFFQSKVYYAQPIESHIRITGRDGRRVYLGLKNDHQDMAHASRKYASTIHTWLWSLILTLS
jgi:hypothetical protein